MEPLWKQDFYNTFFMFLQIAFMRSYPFSNYASYDQFLESPCPFLSACIHLEYLHPFFVYDFINLIPVSRPSFRFCSFVIHFSHCFISELHKTHLKQIISINNNNNNSIKQGLLNLFPALHCTKTFSK